MKSAYIYYIVTHILTIKTHIDISHNHTHLDIRTHSLANITTRTLTDPQSHLDFQMSFKLMRSVGHSRLQKHSVGVARLCTMDFFTSHVAPVL